MVLTTLRCYYKGLYRVHFNRLGLRLSKSEQSWRQGKRRRQQDSKCLPPFEIEVGDGEVIVEAFEGGMEVFVLVVLPLSGGGIAEEDPAAEGADGVDAAEFSDLEGTAGAVPVLHGGGNLGGLGPLLDGVEEGGELDGGDEESMAVFLEAAASA